MKKNIYFVMIIFCLIAGIYAQAIDNPLFFDSNAALSDLLQTNKPELMTFENVKNTVLSWVHYFIFHAKFHLTPGRDLLWRTLHDLASLGIGLQGQMVFSIFLHFINALLMFSFIRQLYSDTTAKYVALFFAVNPVAVYAVCYLVNRSQLLMLFFGLLQAIFYIKALETKRLWASFLFFGFSCYLCKMAMLAKEHAIVFLCLYPLLALVFRKHWRRSAMYFAIMGCAAIYTLQQYINYFGTIGEYYHDIIDTNCAALIDQTHLYLRSVLTQTGLFFRYFAYWFLPLPVTSIDMRFEFADSVRQIQGLVVFVLFSLTSLWLFCKKSTRGLGLGFLIALFFFVPELSRTRIAEIFVLYRSYIFSLGYMVALGWFVEEYFGILRASGTIAVFAVFSLCTFFNIKSFNSEVEIWKRATSIIDTSNPAIACQAPRAFMNAGAALLKASSDTSAMKRIGATCDEVNFYLKYKLSNGDFYYNGPERKYVEKAVDNCVAAVSKRLAEESIPYFKTACEFAPDWDAPLSNLGVAYYFAGNLQQAEIVFGQLVKTASKQEIIDQSQTFLQVIAQQRKKLEVKK